MKLFGYLPETLFQPLAGQKRHVYARVLLRLYQRVFAARVLETPTRDDVLGQVASALREAGVISPEELEEEGIERDANPNAHYVTEWQIARLHWEKFRRELRQLQTALKKLRADVQTKETAAVTAAAKVTRLDADYTRVELTLKSSDAEQLASMYESDRSRAIAERENAMAPVRLLVSLASSIEALTERRIIAGRDDILHGLLSAVALAQKPVALSRWGTVLPDNWEELAGHLDAAFAAVTAERLSQIEKVAETSLFTAQKEVQKIQDRIDQIDVNLKRLVDGRSPIEVGTSTLLKALEAAGISAEPLCDIVEVQDQKWRLAAEAALGRSREALIVEPERAVQALEIYRRGSEDAYPPDEPRDCTGNRL